jgi:transcriptional regulator with XRE-family HTH domain
MAELSRTRRIQGVDLHVGRRVRARRRELRLSMEALGCQLGVTYQQIQKYEKGANRISASMLYEIAAALETSVAYFYDGLSDRPADDACYRHRARADAVAATPGGASLLDAYLTLSPMLRAPLVQLVCRMAGEDVVPLAGSERDVQFQH